MSRFIALNALLQPVKDGEDAVAELDTQQNLIIALPNAEFEQLHTFDEAQRMCADLRVGGHDDWRLPTVAEAFACVDYTRHDPATQSQAFGSTKEDWAWTSSPCAWRSGASWCVGFSFGNVGYYFLDNRCFVRAVRSVPPAPGQ
ncbi:MAG: DUF1566 domain-containing protein [Achromobacter sp.]|nr:DUF1566 domain-containing protein [Achromobacter sp.]